MSRSDQFLITATVVLLLQGCSSSSEKISDKANQRGQASTNDNLAEIERMQKSAKLDQVKDSFTICSVNDTPLTMGEYRRQLRTQQQQFQSSLTVNPQMRDEVLRLAQQKGISLTAQEKKQMLDRASTLKKAGSQAFRKMLKDSKASQSDFDKEVLDMGLACKTSKMMIEDSLLRQLINRQLLCDAAKENGFSKQALNKFNEVKQSPQYQEILQGSGLTPEAVESELIKNDLSGLMINKIKSQVSVSDADLRKFYNQNKARMKHGDRIKLSQILIKAPSQDIGTIQSLKTQIQKAHPKMSEDEVEKHVQAALADQHQRADSLLVRARSGADFAELANQNTEDAPARQAKNGGDLGFQEESKLPKQFLDQISSVKVGEVAPQLVESPVGFHIIKLTAKEPAGVLSFDEAKETIKSFLTEQKSTEAVQQWMEKQRQKAKVTLAPDFQALLASEAKENQAKNIKTP